MNERAKYAVLIWRLPLYDLSRLILAGVWPQDEYLDRSWLVQSGAKYLHFHTALKVEPMIDEL